MDRNWVAARTIAGVGEITGASVAVKTGGNALFHPEYASHYVYGVALRRAFFH
jgi:hypothetical protein